MIKNSQKVLFQKSTIRKKEIRIFRSEITLLVMLLFFSVEAVSAQTGNLRGEVTDASTGETLIGANIILVGTAVGTATNSEGEYRLRNLPTGNQFFSVGYMGYKSIEFEVDIVAGETKVRNIELDLDVVEGEEIEIQAQALAQAEAIRRQLSSNTIINVVSESRLRELPDVNAAESVGRLPGVSILRDAGEGQKVAIRGLGPQYNSVTIDGDRVTSTDLGGRSVDMSMISPEMLSGIEMYKILRPDMDADAIGGSVNFSFSGAPSDNQYRISLSSGYHSQINGIGTYKGSASGSNRFFNDRLGVLATISSQRVDRSSHVFSAGYNVLRSAREDEPHAPIETNSVRLIDRREIRERHGMGLNLDFKTSKSHFFLNNFFSRLNRDEYSLRRGYEVDNNNQDWRFQDRELKLDILTSSLSGKHTISDEIFNVDWRISRNQSVQDRPYENTVLFREQNALNRDTYYVGMPPEEVPGAAYNNIENTSLESLDHQIQDSHERDLTASMNIEVPIRFGKYITGNIKLGGKHYNKERSRENRGWGVRGWMFVPRYQSYDIITHDEFPLTAAEDGNPAVSPFVEIDPYSILDDQYGIGMQFDRQLTNSMWENTGDLYFHNTAARTDDYEVNEQVSAGFLMTELNIGERLMILPGVRYEFENSVYDAVRKDFSIPWPDEAGWNEHEDRLEEVSARREEGMWFPMVQARYRATKWLTLRVARTQTTSRPSYSQLTPRRIINQNSRTVSRGQPNIALPKATNYDAFISINNNYVGLLSLGGYYKEIEDLVFNRETVALEPEEMELPGSTEGFTVNEPINNPNLTTVRGFEVEWQSNFLWLPSPFNGIAINANFSRIFSEAQYPGFKTERTSEGVIVVDTFRVAPMVHQPDFISNISVGYDFKGFSARISMLYQGATLTSIGVRPETDQFTEDYLRWDLSLKQELFDDFASIFMNVQNLTNRRDFAVQFSKQYPRSMEYYGWTMDMGIRIKL